MAQPGDQQATTTVAEVARALNVSPLTVRRWIKTGMIQATRSHPRGGSYRIPVSELERLRSKISRASMPAGSPEGWPSGEGI